MTPRRRLTAEQTQVIGADLLKRMELMKQLSRLNFKRLASTHGIGYHAVWRLAKRMQNALHPSRNNLTSIQSAIVQVAKSADGSPPQSPAPADGAGQNRL